MCLRRQGQHHGVRHLLTDVAVHSGSHSTLWPLVVQLSSLETNWAPASDRLVRTWRATRTMWVEVWRVAACLLATAPLVYPCTTLAVTKGASQDGSVILAHSNDGNGDVAGTVEIVPRASHPAGSVRKVHGGVIPQVATTFKYFTKPGGYASVNEFEVGLAESTCNGVYEGNASGLVNIVDLSAIALERARTAREAIQVMGSIATTHGYNDNAESLFVGDRDEVFVFHVQPDDTKHGALWVAQRIPDGHVAAVANSFVVRTVDMNNATSFLYSASLPRLARQRGWQPGQDLDFTALFSGPEMGHRYSSGRRMWVAFETLAAQHLSPNYTDYVKDHPYNASYAVLGPKPGVRDVMATMRNYYRGTFVDPTVGLAAGPFGTPDRWAPGPGEAQVHGAWERTIATPRSIISYVLWLRSAAAATAAGSAMWLAPHAAHTSVYVPLLVSQNTIPAPYANASVSRVDRGLSAWQASRFVFNIAQLRFNLAIADVAQAQHKLESGSMDLIATCDRLVREQDPTRRAAMAQDLTKGGGWHLQQQQQQQEAPKHQHPQDPQQQQESQQHQGSQQQDPQLTVHQLLERNAEAVVARWWQLSDELLLRYADGYCNGCADHPRDLGYPAWWLRAVGYQQGPPPPAAEASDSMGAADLLAAYDRNGDGVLDATELTPLAQATQLKG
eukprot:m.339376 g.339376  ORF g.339376 m.339376 type:complete len:673 (+) comp19817_c0_seq7:253-2271(+)